MSPKHDVLSKEEVERSNLSDYVVQLINTYSNRFNIPYSSLRILDWGCGRGATVIKLLKMGIDAYGVDIDAGPIKNGSALMYELGFNAEERLLQIQPNCETPFQDRFFHIILSDQVFEHVSDLPALAKELSRLTCLDGQGLHFFPAKYCIVEPHLFIPFVHWLPKNKLRYWWIRLMLNRIPLWKGLEKASIVEKTNVYYQYSLQKTYCRSLHEIKNILLDNDLEVKYHAFRAPTRKYKVIFPILWLKNGYSNQFWSNYSNTFRSVVLTTQRNS